MRRKEKRKNGSQGQGLICHFTVYLFYISAGLQASGGDAALGVIALRHTIAAYDSMIEVIKHRTYCRQGQHTTHPHNYSNIQCTVFSNERVSKYRKPNSALMKMCSITQRRCALSVYLRMCSQTQRKADSGWSQTARMLNSLSPYEQDNSVEILTLLVHSL